ncbi:hypothetical protein SVIOM342S_03831 [Streptomyces violaceorubidus]
MKASRTDSLATAASAGSAVCGSTRASGIGSSQVWSGRGDRAAWASGVASVRSIGRARLLPAVSMSRQTLVAIRYSHERRLERPSNLS